MRVTSLDKSYPLSYTTTSNDSSIAVFSSGLVDTVLNSSNSLIVHVTAVPDIGGHSFAEFENDDYLRLFGNTNTGSDQIVGNSSLAFGSFMEAPSDDEKYGYNVSGFIRPLAAVPSFAFTLGLSLFVGHLDTTHANNHQNVGNSRESYFCNVISEIPLLSVGGFAGADAYHIPYLHFNYSFHDNGVPPNETSRIFFGLCYRNFSPHTIDLKSVVFNINVWRQRAPIKLYNQWQA